MENAVQALKTAAAVLIFVIAITVSFTMFSKAKATADTIIKSQDSQEYLEAAELAGTLYSTTGTASTGENATITTDGYRIVDPDDVISTIYRYNLEKYGVTLIKPDGDVIVRFDSNTESLMRQWETIQGGQNSNNEEVTAEQQKEDYAEVIKKNTTVALSENEIKPNFSADKLEEIYKIEVKGNSNIKCGAPWYGNEVEIIKRINADIAGIGYILNRTKIFRKENYNRFK